MNIKITFENLIAGALVIFGKVDRLSLGILLDQINQFYNSNIEEKIIRNENIVTFCGEYKIADSTPEEIEERREELFNIQGQAVITFFEQLDCHDLILKKVSELKCIHIEDIPSFFSNVEQILLQDLRKNGDVTNIWNFKFAPDKFQELTLTNRGKARLFKFENKKKIEEFISRLESEGLNTAVLSDFLEAQDYDSNPDVYEILNLENFRIFCMVRGYNLFSELPEQPESPRSLVKKKFTNSKITIVRPKI